MRQIVTMLMMAVAVLSSTTMLGEEIYEIYPVPQVQLAGIGQASFTKQVTIVAEAGIDEVTVERAKQVLTEHDLTATVANHPSKKGSNLLLGINGSGGEADKRIRKKDLGLIASTYGYVYVAQVAMGASDAQCLKAIREAEAYDGPSPIIAYAPCINHGLKAGMGKSQAEEAKAVECGYWHLWRYNPELEKEGKNPFTLDSKEPDWDKFEDFLKGEVRYASVVKQYPEEAAQLFAAAKENAQWRYNNYRRLAQQQWGVEPENK